MESKYRTVIISMFVWLLFHISVVIYFPFKCKHDMRITRLSNIVQLQIRKGIML
jgi:hypothetical protein